jgi:hypothetical protein
MMNRLRKYVLLLLVLVAALALSGCIKVRAVLIIEEGESGTYGIGMGMTEEAISFFSSMGEENPMDGLAEEMEQSPEFADKEVTINEWSDGEYQWVEAVVPFENLEELQAAVEESELFDSFSLTHEPGLLTDGYVLDAQMAAMEMEGMEDMDTEGMEGMDTEGMEGMEGMEGFGDFDMDPSTLITAEFVVHLPGDVVETSGTEDDLNGTPVMIWTVDTTGPTGVYLVTESMRQEVVEAMKGRTLVSVTENNDGYFGRGIGLDEQAKQLMASEGDPMTLLTDNLDYLTGYQPPSVVPNRWVDGPVEGVEFMVTFADLEGLAGIATQSGAFSSFSLSYQPSTFKDRYVLDAQLNPRPAEFPASLIDTDMVVQMPGDVVESNGSSATVGGVPSQVWKVSATDPVNVHVVTESMKTDMLLIVGVVAVGVIGFGLVVIALIVILTGRSRKKKRQPSM